MFQCKARTCLHVVFAMIAFTLAIYFIGEFYLSELIKINEFSRPTPMPMPPTAGMKGKEEEEGGGKWRRRSKVVDREKGVEGKEQKFYKKGVDPMLANIIDEMGQGRHKIGKNYDPINCGLVLRNDQLYIGRHRARQPAFRYKDPNHLAMNCGTIARRNNFVVHNDDNIGQQRFPIAFARNVFKDYRFLEMELLANYSAQNWYCYSLDANAAGKFKRRMRQLAKCFPNVLVLAREFRMDSAGHRTSDALVECAGELAKVGRKWDYLITLQNHDVQIKSNVQMSEMLAALEGANDIEFGEQSKFTKQRLRFYLENYSWNLKDLNIFKNKKIAKFHDRNGRPLALRLAKGSMCASLSRQFVDHILANLDLKIVLNQFNGSKFGVDEHLFQSLASTPELFGEGGGKKGEKKNEVARVNDRYGTRYVLWDWDNDKGRCRSGIRRHAVCVFGLADLGTHFVDNDFLFANKMMPEVDMEAIYCWHREMKMRNGN